MTASIANGTLEELNKMREESEGAKRKFGKFKL
jgi:hypothetical protein